MKPENIKIISSKIDRETKEGKIVIEVEETLSDKARDHAKEVEKFYSPTIEAYRLRAKNSFEAGYNSVKEIPQSVNLLAKFFLKERSESDHDSDKLEEMDDYFMQVYQKNTGNSFSFARLKAIEAVLIKYGYQLVKGEKEQLINAMGWMSRELSRLNDITGQDNRIEEQLCVVHEIINKIEPHPKEIPDEVVYVQRTGFPPTEMWYGVVNKYGLINQEYFNGEMWVNCEDPKAWLEPIQLKDLLAK